jgi:hypothetical protein
VTPAPAYAVGVMELWPEIQYPDPGLPDAASSALSSLSKIGDFDDAPGPTRTSGSDTCNTQTAWPYPTLDSAEMGEAYCYGSIRLCGQAPRVPFNRADAEEAVARFCEAGHILETTHNTVFSEYTNSDNRNIVYVAASWPLPQDSRKCGVREEFRYGNTAECYEAFMANFFCDDETGRTKKESYGGGYILASGQGCVLLTLDALEVFETTTTGSRKSRVRGLGGRF